MLKRYLCKIEGLGGIDNSTLYQSLLEQTALDDSTRLSFRGTPGPGLSDRDPMALVVDGSAVKGRSHGASTVDPSELLERDYELRYVYYVVYDQDGGVGSKTAFDEKTASLGRVNTLSIPPPHTSASLKSRLIKSEEILGHNIHLFEDEYSEFPMDDNDSIPLLADTFPGFLEDQPLAIAYDSERNTCLLGTEDPNQTQAQELIEARCALEESRCEVARLREECEKAKNEARSALDQLRDARKSTETAFREGASPAQLKALSEMPSFTQKLIGIKNEKNAQDPQWNSISVGEIFYTNGISRDEIYAGGSEQHPCYLAVSSSGKLGFVDTVATTLC